MNKWVKLILTAFLLFLLSHAFFGADLNQQQDTIRVKTRTNESIDNKDYRGNQGAQGNNNQQSANAGKNNSSQGVKKVNGARPDMSKARGARPPHITRPSGSGVPRGMGKPGGAGKKPGR
jgi:hypothetical protein